MFLAPILGFFRCIILFAVLFLSAENAFASLDFSVVPVEGGSSIRFTRGDLTNDVTKEVRIRITSNDNIQYQVFQQLVSPFTNERGVTLDRPVLEASILPGSSGSGTTYLSSYEPLHRGEQLLYTSSASGMSESFTLVYHVDPQYLSDSGSFNGLIQYTLRPIGGGQRQTVNANVFIDSNAELQTEIETSTGGKIVKIDTRDQNRPASVRLSYNGNGGSNLRVYSEVINYPINDLNSQLDSGILKVLFEGAQNGELSYQGTVDLPRNRTLIYKSTQQSDSFSLLFSLSTSGSLADLSAGSYRGLIRFYFETDHHVKTIDVDLDVKISPVFEIVLNFPQGPISFDKIVPEGEPEVRSLEVEVKTNLHRPYVVKQKVGDLLVNEKGQSIPKKYFVLREDNQNDSGRVAHNDFQPVEPGESEIYFSDSKGTPAKFIVYYRLSPFTGMTPGDYRTSMVYDLGEL